MKHIEHAGRYANARLIDRDTDEFIGICKGIIFDGLVSEDEAINLLAWLNTHPAVANAWPGEPVFRLLKAALSENTLSSEAESELLTLLTSITGNPEVITQGGQASTLLPFDNPMPDLFFENAVFVLTGTFKIGNRASVEALVTSLGAEVVKKNVRKDTNFLVIADIGSKAWIHSTHGRKIERAVELRDNHQSGLAIVSEEHFYRFLPGA
jgi:NAD-dependent DNA ligase